MEVADALRIPLEPAQVREALGDLALVRASIDDCESLVRLAGGEYTLRLTVVPHYAIRAHVADATRLPRHDGRPGEVDAQTLSFKARGEGVGSLRGQIAVAPIPDEDGASTWIEYTVWATLIGPLAGLPARQIENSLREVADDFFIEFGEVVRAKHGHPPRLSRSNRGSRGATCSCGQSPCRWRSPVTAPLRRKNPARRRRSMPLAASCATGCPVTRLAIRIRTACPPGRGPR